MLCSRKSILCVLRRTQLIGVAVTSTQRCSASSQNRYPALAESIARRKQDGEELALAWVTPRSLACGLEGGILARLLSIPGINLMGARMYAPSDNMIDEMIAIHNQLYRPKPIEAFVHYLESLKAVNDEKRGYPNHLMMMLFTGKNNVVNNIMEVIGRGIPDPRDPHYGKTIRGAYGFHKRDSKTGKTVDLEPALVGAQTPEICRKYLALFSKYADTDGGVLLKTPKEWDETGLVMIKPDMLERPSSKPGHIMDLFSSTGLRLVGCRLVSFSVKEAMEFYGFLQPIFAKKLAGKVEKEIRRRMEGAFDFAITDEQYKRMAAVINDANAASEVANIVEYMCGVYPRPDMTEAEKNKRGTARCLALLYHGPDPINTIRTKLGSTDPGQAEVGTIRIEYGRDVMRNSAHASDSTESLHRERKIIGFHKTRTERAAMIAQKDFHPCAVKVMIDQWLGL